MKSDQIPKPGDEIIFLFLIFLNYTGQQPKVLSDIIKDQFYRRPLNLKII